MAPITKKTLMKSACWFMVPIEYDRSDGVELGDNH